MSVRMKVTVVALVILAPIVVRAQIVSDPARLGAFFGAMKYCEERYDEKERRYRWVRLGVADEISHMSGNDRLRSLAASRIAHKNGRFLGNNLNKRECRSLLSASEWKRFVQR